MSGDEQTMREMADRIMSGQLFGADELVEPELQQVDRYRIVRLIGQGAAGQVYEATDPEVGREVAIKLLDRTVARNIERFQREMIVLGQLNHPGIVTIFDAGTHQGRPYYVMEYAAGQSLAQASLPLRETVEVLRQVALACQAAHDQGVVHRDLKPGNILLGTRPMVADFGIAKVFDADLTDTGQLLGTPHYMAPEQVQGLAVDARTDVHALGVMLYEAISGRLPYQGQSLVELFREIEHQAPAPPRQPGARVSRELETICLKALAKQPMDRYQTAALLAEDFAAWLEGRPISAQRSLPLPAWVRRKQVWISLILLCVLGLFVRRWVRAPTPPPEPQTQQQPPPRDAPGRQRIADAQQRIYDQLLKLEHWESNLYRKSERLSHTQLARIIVQIQLELDWNELPPKLRHLGLFATAHAHLLMGRTREATAELTAAIEIGEGPRMGLCYFERARISWETMLRESLSGNKAQAQVRKQRVAADLALALRAGLEDAWLRDLAQTLHLLASRGEQQAVRDRALETADRLRKTPEKPIEEVAKFVGDMQLMAGQTDRAIAEYRWAIDRRYHYLEARNGLALAYLLSGKGIASLERAFRTAFKAIQINPWYEDSYFCFTLLCRSVLATSVEQMNKTMVAIKPAFVEKIVATLQQGTELLPKSEVVRLTYGYACLLQGWQLGLLKQDPMPSRKAAVAALKPLETSDDDRMAFGALLGLGMIHLLRASRLKVFSGGQMKRARDYLERARKLSPRQPAVYYWLGWQRFLAQQYREAADAWEAACSLQPTMRAELQRNIDRAKRLAGVR